MSNDVKPEPSPADIPADVAGAVGEIVTGVGEAISGALGKIANDLTPHPEKSGDKPAGG